MPNKPNMETRSVEDLQREAPALVKQVAETKQPIRIQVPGQPPVVLLDEDTYDSYIHLINLSRLINEGEADIRAGRVRPFEEFFKEFLHGKRVSP
jgi:PHD/YefM family antitoxin component YafN of YafNO toxin-antitoxin module